VSNEKLRENDYATFSNFELFFKFDIGCKINSSKRQWLRKITWTKKAEYLIFYVFTQNIVIKCFETLLSLYWLISLSNAFIQITFLSGVYTLEEVANVSKERLIKLQSLYIKQFKHLHHQLKEKRRQFLLDGSSPLSKPSIINYFIRTFV